MAISKSSSVESIMDEIPVKASDKKRNNLKSGMMNFGNSSKPDPAPALKKTAEQDKNHVKNTEEKIKENITKQVQTEEVKKEEKMSIKNAELTERVDNAATMETKQKHAGGRPKMYEGELAVITIKTEKKVKDMAQSIIRKRKISMVQYLNELIENDYLENYID